MGSLATRCALQVAQKSVTMHHVGGRFHKTPFHRRKFCAKHAAATLHIPESSVRGWETENAHARTGAFTFTAPGEKTIGGRQLRCIRMIVDGSSLYTQLAIGRNRQITRNCQSSREVQGDARFCASVARARLTPFSRRFVKAGERRRALRVAPTTSVAPAKKSDADRLVAERCA